MRHPLVALILACLIVGCLMGLPVALHSTSPSAQTKIDIRSTQNVGDIISAIEALKRPDVNITSGAPYESHSGLLGAVLMMSFGSFIFTGLVLVVFKIICRLMGISSTV